MSTTVEPNPFLVAEGLADPLPEVMTRAEVARFLRLSDWTVNDLARRGEIPSVKFGRSRRFIRDDVRAYLRERTAQR